MERTIIRALAITGIFVCLIGFVTSQVTLSKGWGPGKRSIYDDTCKVMKKNAISICYALVSELKRLTACETRKLSASGQGMDEMLSSWPSMPFTDGR